MKSRAEAFPIIIVSQNDYQNPFLKYILVYIQKTGMKYPDLPASCNYIKLFF